MTTSLAFAEPTVPIPRASFTAAELGVIIIAGDPVSEAIGAYYQAARKIPVANVVRVNLPSNVSYNENALTADGFNFIKKQVDAALPANVQATVLTWTFPFRVLVPAGARSGACYMSITSAFAAGVKDGCTFTSAYFDSSSTHPWQDHGIRPSMMLGAATLDEARALIDRGVKADNTYPTGDGYLFYNFGGEGERRSNVRHEDFKMLPDLWDYPEGLKLSYIYNKDNVLGYDELTNTKDVLFYFRGSTNAPGLETNTYLPGAVADHLTSFGGLLSGSYQMESTEWIKGGLTGSYGTVEEPMANEQKFPKVSVLVDHYYRGATLIEAYWKSVEQPYQGLFLGEPLARPFADQPTSSIVGNEYVLNTRSLRRDYPIAVLSNVWNGDQQSLQSGYSQYVLQSKSSMTSEWEDVAKISTAQPMQKEYRLPVVKNATELRLKELLTPIVRIPTPFSTDPLATCPAPTTAQVPLLYDQYNIETPSYVVPTSITTQSAPSDVIGGREQTVYYKIKVKHNRHQFLNCGSQVFSLSVPNTPDGISATVTPSTFNLLPGEYAYATIQVNIPAVVGKTQSVMEALTLSLTDKNGVQSIARVGATENLPLEVYSAASNMASKLSIVLPNKLDEFVDYPERTSQYVLPLVANISPDSEITNTDWELRKLDDNYDNRVEYLPPVSGVTFFTTNSGYEPTKAQFYLGKVMPGCYTLTAKGYDDNRNLIATANQQFICTSQQLNSINGTPKSETILGTAGNDIINSARGADMVTGGKGENIYVLTGNILALNTSEADIITDFVPGKDRIDVMGVLTNLGYTRATALEKQVVRVVDVNGNATVQIYPNGKSNTVGKKDIFILKGVLAKDVDVAREMQLTPRQHLFAPKIE